MVRNTLAIIGTAGRGQDKSFLTSSHYNRMFKATLKVMQITDMDMDTLRVYSGGAAWADHLAVTLVLVGVIKPENLTLYLPTEIGDHGFYGTEDKSNKTASTCNYYHRMFSDTLEMNSIQQILRVRELGAICDPGKGNFFARNALVAKAVSPDGVLLAFTFGSDTSDQPPWSLTKFGGVVTADQAGLKDGGTAHTWGCATGTKFHGKIGKETDHVPPPRDEAVRS